MLRVFALFLGLRGRLVLKEGLVRVAAMQRHQERLVTEGGLDVLDRGAGFVADSAKNEDFLVGLVVADHAHGVVAYVVHTLAVHGVLHVQPDLLVQHEQHEVVDERRKVLFAERFVSA